MQTTQSADQSQTLSRRTYIMQQPTVSVTNSKLKQAACSKKTGFMGISFWGFVGMGIMQGYTQAFLWVWDEYGDRNSVPTAALIILHIDYFVVY